MASSSSGQDEPNRVLWLATRAGKMEPSCLLGTTCCIPQAKFPQKPYNKSFIDQVCSAKMAGYWPRSFFASLWTSTSSRSINTQKKNLANIQPSWPHTWSITHTYCTVSENLLPFPESPGEGGWGASAGAGFSSTSLINVWSSASDLKQNRNRQLVPNIMNNKLPDKMQRVKIYRI